MTLPNVKQMLQFRQVLLFREIVQRNGVSSLLKNSQTKMSVPPEASGLLKKVGRTFLSGRDSMVFQQAARRVQMMQCRLSRERQAGAMRSSNLEK